MQRLFKQSRQLIVQHNCCFQWWSMHAPFVCTAGFPHTHNKQLQPQRHWKEKSVPFKCVAELLYFYTQTILIQDVNENQWQYLTKYFSAPPGPKVIKCGAIQSAWNPECHKQGMLREELRLYLSGSNTWLWRAIVSGDRQNGYRNHQQVCLQ